MIVQLKNIIKKLINRLHNNKITHGDLKSSNIGVYLNNDEIMECIYLDCSKVRRHENDPKSLKKYINHDLKTYNEHLKNNLKSI